jgi:histidinol-phosphate aminotransferase
LHLNECPYSPPDFIIENVVKILKKCNQYPSKTLFDQFRELIADYVGVDIDNVYPFTGADSALRTIFSVLAKPEDKVLYVEPTFAMVKVYITNLGLKPVAIQSIEDDEWWYVSIDELLSKAHNVDIAIIIDPNNPTGSPIAKGDKEFVKTLAKSVSKYVVFDEAYYEFAGYTVVKYIDEVPNFVVVRSLSKAFCLAGFRLGYIVGNKEVIAKLSSIHTSFDIPTPCLAAGVAALQNKGYMEKIVEEVKIVRESLYEKLRKMGYRVFKSFTNFLLIKDKRDLESSLRKHGIYIKKVGEELYRITVPPINIMDKLLKALGDKT